MSFFSSFTNPAHQEEEDPCSAFQLSRTQRLYGFAICFGIGFILSFLGTLTLISMNLKAFAILYSIGNIVSLMSTGFLVGPMRQCKNMFDPTRIFATIIFLLTLILTIVFALAVPYPANMLAIVFVFIQFLALIWYTASYIPFARDMIKNCFKGICG